MPKIEKDECLSFLCEGNSALIELAQDLENRCKRLDQHISALEESINEFRESDEDLSDFRLVLSLAFIDSQAENVMRAAKGIRKISKEMDKARTQMVINNEHE